MNMDQIKEIAFKSMGKRKSHVDRESGFAYYHGERVANLALALRKKLFPADDSKDELIYVGGLFHDLGKGINPHNQTGAVLVQEVLKDCCTPEECKEIAQIIHSHNQRKKSADFSMAELVVQDADLLDHFGTIEIWLKILYSAHYDEAMEDAVQHWKSERFADLLERSRADLNFDYSIEIFNERAQFVQEFSQRFTIESQGGIAL